MMPSMHFDAYACALQDAGRRVPGRRHAPSPQLGVGLTQAFKVTGSPAVLSQAVRGRNRD